MQRSGSFPWLLKNRLSEVVTEVYNRTYEIGVKLTVGDQKYGFQSQLMFGVDAAYISVSAKMFLCLVGEIRRIWNAAI